MISKMISSSKLLIIICSLAALASPVEADCVSAKDPSRTVVAGGSITEIIYLLQKSDQLAGVDVTSNFPQKAKTLPSIGYIRNLSVEGILSLEPTLILSESDIGPKHVVQQLQDAQLDLRIIDTERSISGIIEKIYCVAQILNVDPMETDFLVNKLKKQSESLQGSTPKITENRSSAVFILMMRGTQPIVAAANTSGSKFLQMAGFENAFRKASGWTSVGKETLASVNPDIIILTKRAFRNFESYEHFLSEIGVFSYSDHRKTIIHVDDGMAMLGFGPRTIEAANAATRAHEITKGD